MIFNINQKTVYAQKLYGTVSDSSGEALAFVNVYVKSNQTGTTTNELGKYQLQLKPGSYEIVYQFIGYKKQIKKIEITQKDLNIDVQLIEEAIALQEVIVNSKEDPAYAIMRKAIAKRKAYYEAIESYKAKVYIKGLQRIVSAPDKIMGIPINSSGILDSNNAGIIYLSESNSEFSYQKPGKIKENLVASKVSGNSNNFSWNSASDFDIIDFYQNSINLDLISDRVLMSPLSDNAMFYYQFQLLDIQYEDSNAVYKIAVTPKRKNDPVYTGIIYINDRLFNLHSLELFLTKNNQINFFDTLKISQTFVPLNDTLWMPLSKRFDIVFNLLKIKAEGYYLAFYRDYEVNPAFEKKYFSNEVLKVDENANKKDNLFWENSRPIKLTDEEINDYQKKDSLEILHQSSKYTDSLDRINNRFKPINTLFGYTYQKTKKKISIQTSPLFNAINFNTIEGYNLSWSLDFKKEFKQNQLVRIEPAFRFGFTSGLISATLNSRYYYLDKKAAYIGVEGGQMIRQFNRNNPIGELVNSLYSLLRETNYMKLFKEEYLALNHRYEIWNGLMLYTTIKYSNRIELENDKGISPWNDVKDRVFSSNIPQNEHLSSSMAFPHHQAFIVYINVRYRPGQKYISRPDMKIRIPSKWPEFSVAFNAGIKNVLGSDTRYQRFQFEIKDQINLKILGKSEYILLAGFFTDKKNIPFMDFKHFDGNRVLFGSNFESHFQALDYYKASTTSAYYEGHFQHHFRGFIFNKIPGIRKLKLHEVVGVHALYNKDFENWVEFDVGIENIFKIIRIDFITGIGSQQNTRHAIRVGIELRRF